MKKIVLFICIVLFSINVNAIDIIHSNTDLNPEDIIEPADLINMFTRNTVRWPNGFPINVFTKPINSIEHKVFVTAKLGITPYRFKILLEKAIYAGFASPPTTVISDNEMYYRVANTPFSIGYLDNGDALVNTSNAVIIIK